jgi:hypothetical protein
MSIFTNVLEDNIDLFSRYFSINNYTELKNGALSNIINFLSIVDYDVKNHYDNTLKEMNFAMVEDEETVDYYLSQLDVSVTTLTKPAKYNGFFVIKKSDVDYKFNTSNQNSTSSISTTTYKLDKNSVTFNSNNLYYTLLYDCEIVFSKNISNGIMSATLNVFTPFGKKSIGGNVINKSDVYYYIFDMSGYVEQKKIIEYRYVVPRDTASHDDTDILTTFNIDDGVINENSGLYDLSVNLSRTSGETETKIIPLTPKTNRLATTKYDNVIFYKFDTATSGITITLPNGVYGKGLVAGDVINFKIEVTDGELGNMVVGSMYVEGVTIKDTDVNNSLVDIGSNDTSVIFLTNGSGYGGKSGGKVSDKRKSILSKIQERGSLLTVDDFEKFFFNKETAPNIQIGGVNVSNFVNSKIDVYDVFYDKNNKIVKTATANLPISMMKNNRFTNLSIRDISDNNIEYPAMKLTSPFVFEEIVSDSLTGFSGYKSYYIDREIVIDLIIEESSFGEIPTLPYNSVSLMYDGFNTYMKTPILGSSPSNSDSLITYNGSTIYTTIGNYDFDNSVRSNKIDTNYLDDNNLIGVLDTQLEYINVSLSLNGVTGNVKLIPNTIMSHDGEVENNNIIQKIEIQTHQVYQRVDGERMVYGVPLIDSDYYTSNYNSQFFEDSILEFMKVRTASTYVSTNITLNQLFSNTTFFPVDTNMTPNGVFDEGGEDITNPSINLDVRIGVNGSIMNENGVSLQNLKEQIKDDLLKEINISLRETKFIKIQLESKLFSKYNPYLYEFEIISPKFFTRGESKVSSTGGWSFHHVRLYLERKNINLIIKN